MEAHLWDRNQFFGTKHLCSLKTSIQNIREETISLQNDYNNNYTFFWQSLIMSKRRKCQTHNQRHCIFFRLMNKQTNSIICFKQLINDFDINCSKSK